MPWSIQPQMYKKCLFFPCLCLGPIFHHLSEFRGLQYEHPHARPPGEFLRGHSLPGPEGRRAAGETRLRARCDFLTHGHKGEPLAADSDRCQQEEGRRGRRTVCAVNTTVTLLLATGIGVKCGSN